VTAEIRAELEQLEASGLDARSSELLAVLCWLARDEVVVPAQELDAARRRALLVLAAGGDPHRDLDLDSVAAERLADELDSTERRAQLADALAAFPAEGLAAVSGALDVLRAEPELAWRGFALALLADEIAEE